MYDHIVTHANTHVHTLDCSFTPRDGEWFIAFHSCAFTFSVRGGLGRAMLSCFPGEQRYCYHCFRFIAPLLSALLTADTSLSSVRYSISSDLYQHKKDVLCSCLMFCFRRVCVLCSVVGLMILSVTFNHVDIVKYLPVTLKLGYFFSFLFFFKGQGFADECFWFTLCLWE